MIEQLAGRITVACVNYVDQTAHAFDGSVPEGQVFFSQPRLLEAIAQQAEHVGEFQNARGVIWQLGKPTMQAGKVLQRPIRAKRTAFTADIRALRPSGQQCAMRLVRVPFVWCCSAASLYHFTAVL